MGTRAGAWAVSFVAGLVWVGLLSVVLAVDADSSPRIAYAAEMLLDRDARLYPFTIQNAMWLVFFVAAGEQVLRFLASGGEAEQLGRELLPEDQTTVLTQKNIGEYYRRLRLSDEEGRYWLQRLALGVILRFQSSGSVEQVNAVFSASMDLYQHETELRYNMLRYLVWLIPTLGFVGTVMGIANALDTAGQEFSGIDPNANMAELGPQMMDRLTGQLGVAFYTTLLALLQSAVLMCTMHLIQEREEGALNRVGQYCLKNLVNRLYA